MQTPLIVSFRDVPESESMRGGCRREFELLQLRYGGITGCHVTFARPKRRLQDCNCDVDVRLAVPGGAILIHHAAAEHQSEEETELAIREAFDVARRQLHDLERRRCVKVEHRAMPDGWHRRAQSCAVADVRIAARSTTTSS